jgi:NAD(P)-dependent dehydrogenase (short-subunit alcohol dehydrogenase family)
MVFRLIESGRTLHLSFCRTKATKEIQMETKTAIVTGASSGIGLALARAFLERGYAVLGNARTLSRLKKASEALGSPDRFVPVEGDIGRPEVAERLFAVALERFGHVDVLVNNAGVFIAKPTADYDVADVEQMISTNLKGFVYPSQLAARHMAARGSGSIINITASLAIQPQASAPALLAVLIKGGINQATRALALELAPKGVRVNAIAPGVIETPMHEPATHEFLKALSPMKRLGTTEEIIEAALYLVDAEYTTGVILPVDGGATTGRW